MTTSSIKSFAIEACGRVDDVERLGIKVSRNNNIVSCKIAWPFSLNSFLVDMDVDTRIKLPKGSTGHLCSVLANNILAIGEQELSTSISFSNSGAVKQSERANTSKDKVLGNLIGEGFDGDEKDVCALDLCLRSHAPEANLAIVESNLLCRVLECIPVEYAIQGCKAYQR
jgi:hypothetical protein